MILLDAVFIVLGTIIAILGAIAFIVVPWLILSIGIVLYIVIKRQC